MATFDTKNWDWESGEKLIAETSEWKDKFEWVEEFQVSPDGEKVASSVKTGDTEFSVWVNGETWESAFDKIWFLRFGPDGRLTALVSKEEEWTVAVDGQAWENTFGYVWNTKFSPDGKNIAVAVQQEMQYGAAVNGETWENMFANMSSFTMSPDGRRTAGVVQTKKFSEGEIFRFQEGCFTVAPDGKAWDRSFVNVWGIAFSPDALTEVISVKLVGSTMLVSDNPVPAEALAEEEASRAEVYVYSEFRPATDPVKFIYNPATKLYVGFAVGREIEVEVRGHNFYLTDIEIEVQDGGDM